MNPVSHDGEAGFFHFWRLEVGIPREAGCKKKCLTVQMESFYSPPATYGTSRLQKL